MPAKKKAGRGKTLNIVDFNDDFVPEDNLDWAAEAPPEERPDEQALGEKIAKRDFSRIANNALAEKDGFRSAPTAQTTHPKSAEDLQPPYVAHFGNLRNGMTEEDFLRNFHEDAVISSRLISQDGKSFAFVEFNSAQSLMIALSMNQSKVRGRKLYVDLATQKQIERLHGTPGMSRHSAGQSQQNLNNLNLTRDAFGTTQSEKDFIGGRSGFSSRNDLHALGELSRDVLGTARASDGSPSPTGPPDFSNWRSEGPASQPEFQPNPMRDNRRSDTDLEKRGAFRNNNNYSNNNINNTSGSKHQSPLSAGGLASWRDEPVAQAPMHSTGPASPTETGENNNNSNSNNNNNNNNRKGFGTKSGGDGNNNNNNNRGNRGAPRQAPPPRDDSKWEALRR